MNLGLTLIFFITFSSSASLTFIFLIILSVLVFLSIFLYWLVFHRIFQKKPVEWRTLHAVMIFLYIMLYLYITIFGIVLSVLMSYPYVKLLIFRYKLKKMKHT